MKGMDCVMQPRSEAVSDENNKRRSSQAAGCTKVQTVKISSMKLFIGASHFHMRSPSASAKE
jgi:hypothetical protein